MIRKAMPVAKLITLKNVITSTKPVRLSERCGASCAENSTGSASLISRPLPAVIGCQYIPFMAKIIRTQRAKSASVRSRPKKKPAKKPKSARVARKLPAKPKALKTKASKPWTQAEVRECFERFRKANPEPRGELEHLNPYTLLVAVV